MPDPTLEYECVMCTRNRLASLRRSIPMILAQSRVPSRVIVVDSSDDHDAVRAMVSELARDAPCEVDVIRSEAGLTLQRNAGLALVRAAVVLFPDDDSLCHPDYAAALLALYERDVEGRVGCVLGNPRRGPEWVDDRVEVPRMGWANSLRQLTVTRRMELERAVVRDPLISIGTENMARWATPSWLSDADGELACWVTGFRMSFRTRAIREAGGFDETLRGYGTCEDVAAGFSIAREYMILQSRHALVYHELTPGGRGSGRLRGATNIANRVYVTARYSAPGSVHRRRALRYAAYRCLLYAGGGITSRYHRESLRGACAVLVRIGPLLRAPVDRAAAQYEALLAAVGVSFI